MNQGMPRYDLSRPDAIRHICETRHVERTNEEGWRGRWFVPQVALLDEVRRATAGQLASEEWRRYLWLENRVSSHGSAPIKMGPILEDDPLAVWIGNVAKMSLPQPPRGSARTRALDEVFDEFADRVRPFTDRRMPWLRIRRIMAAFFPEDFTFVTSDHLKDVGKAMFGSISKPEARPNSTLLNACILDRIEEVLGPTDGSTKEIALRSNIPWTLWEIIDPDR